MGRNTHAICAVVVSANCVVVVSVAASRLLPGAPVVSISTYVLFGTWGNGPALLDGVPADVDVADGVPLGLEVAVGVPVGLPLGERVGLTVWVTVEVLESEEPPDAVPDGVSLPLKAAPVGEPLELREPVGVPDAVPEPDRVPDGVPEGVYVGEGVLDDDAPPDKEAVAEGVWEGVGSITPTTYSGAAYIVPALVTEFHAFVVKVPAVAPVHTFVSCRMP